MTRIGTRCPHCSKRIDDDLIASYLAFVGGVEAAASAMGRKGGRSKNPEKTKHLRRGNPKATPEQVEMIHSSPLPIAELASQTGLGERQVRRIKKGEAWKPGR